MSTSRSTSVRSVMRPSTPRSSSSSHLVGVVDRPDVHVPARRRAPAGRSPAVTTVEPAAAVRHLERRAPRRRVSQVGEPAAGQQPERGRPRRGRPRSATRPPVTPPEARAGGAGERADADPVVGRRCLDAVGERRDRAVGLDVDVERGRPGRRRAASASVGIGSRPPIRARRDLGVRSAREIAPRAVGDPVEDGVVEGEQDAVAGGVHVGLEVAVAELDRVLEGEQVFSRPAISGCRAPPRWANASTGGARWRASR